ncbi:LysR family transcriptional regulator [Sorangium sp. So ce1128]|uniref:LysR family transcriptional regulator n=1 Tax=Sorangium cellulosum TaxID=56 RepID=A0A3S5GYE8_SORCE|nr:LysR family transcriptional regulator [Sorangium cellulosum]
MMELRHLRYFVAVAETEHFGKAAEQLHVSQSPLSRQIAQLEEEVGVLLFTRAGRGVKLSPAGRAFLEGARATLARVALAVEDARATAQGRIGTLVIGFEGGLAYTGLLPKVMSRFRARHPRVEVRLLPLESEAQSAALREGRISVGYGYAYDPVDDDRFVRSRVLFRDRLGVVLPKKHRLANRRTLGIADLKNERFFWAPRMISPPLYAAVLSAFRAQGQSLVIHEENDGEALLTLVASGEGLTFFSESAAAIARIGAVFKRVRDLDIVILGRLVWRAADEADPLVRSLLDLTRAVHEV